MSEDPSANQLEQLMALAVNLLASRFDLREPQPRLFPGTIPADIPLEIPLPPHTRLLGSQAENDRRFVIMLESDLLLDEVLNSYRTQLTALDWKERPSPGQPLRSGFLQSDYRPSAQPEFCHTASHAWLMSKLAERENDTTLVRLELLLGEEGNPWTRPEPPAPQGGHIHPLLHARIQIPTLIAPPGAQLRVGSSSFGRDEMQLTATVTTQAEPEALADHYAKQLTQAGWTQMDAGTGSAFAWSTWHFMSTHTEPVPWSALFFMLKMPDKPDRYALELRAFRSEPEIAE